MTHVTELPMTENNLAAAMLASAIKAKRAPAIAFAKWKDNPPKKRVQIIPNNCLPPITRPAEEVSGHQLLILRTLLEKSKKRMDIVDDLGLPPNSISSALQTLKKRKLICIPRKLKRQGQDGYPVYVYAISEAGRRAVEATE